MKELVIAARESSDAKLEILKSFEPLIKKCFKLYVNDYNLYDEVMQEGYIAILKCINKFDINSGYAFPGYVKAAVIHAIRRISRNTNHYASLDEEIDDDGGRFLDFLSSCTDIETEEIEKQAMEALYAALDKLTYKQREIINLIYFKNRSMKDICRDRRCHYMAVVRLKNRALETLSKELSHYI